MHSSVHEVRWGSCGTLKTPHVSSKLMKLGHQSLTTKDRVAKVSDVPVRKIVSCLETFNILRTIKNFHIFVLSVNMLTPTNCSKKKPSVFLQSVRE